MIVAAGLRVGGRTARGLLRFASGLLRQAGRRVVRLLRWGFGGVTRLLVLILCIVLVIAAADIVIRLTADAARAAWAATEHLTRNVPLDVAVALVIVWLLVTAELLMRLARKSRKDGDQQPPH